MTKEQEAEVKQLGEDIVKYRADGETIRKQFIEVSELRLKLNGALEYLGQKIQEASVQIENIKNPPKEEKKESK